MSYEPVEILTATAGIYIVIIFLISTLNKLVADRLRHRYAMGRR